ncbi:hypothetical protein [uncultured Tenacibaculum sp.]|uniref:hypothetical protein n=1 Tax=uncultured Tenacibaculum sp. TaxID=174713 RepID=UPI00260E8F9D|nr:hypothetical protein [uncultured Tenacibaculum sp.]
MKIVDNKISFFNDSDNNDTSVILEEEKDIVKWLFNNSSILNLITEEVLGLGHKEILFYLEISEPLLNKKDQQIIGDIDAVLIPKSNPEHSVIIEFKRIKINTLENNEVKIHKLSQARNKGFSQIKKLRKFNYFKTFLGIIIEEDSRNVKDKNTLTRASNDKYINQIYNINKDDSLEDKAGLLFLKITQPTGKNFKSFFKFSICLDKEAKEVNQDHETTKRIIDLTNHNILYT